MKKVYEVETLRAGQPRAYADSVYEYRITVKSEMYGKDGMHPWVMHGDVEAQIARDEAARKAGRMFGGQPPDALRKQQRDWAKSLVQGLGRNFREKGDDDGRTGMEAAFFPTLEWLKIDPKAGTVHALISEAYTD